MGAVEQPGVVTDGGGDTDMEAKKPGEAEKAKARKLYAGVQALGYRRDHMEVCTYFHVDRKAHLPVSIYCVHCTGNMHLLLPKHYLACVKRFSA